MGVRRDLIDDLRWFLLSNYFSESPDGSQQARSLKKRIKQGKGRRRAFLFGLCLLPVLMTIVMP